MKHLNFSTKSGSQSGSHRVVTLASTVGSPSVHRRSTMLRLLSVLVLIFTLGIGQMWATADHEKTDSWDFSTSGNDAWSSTNCGSYCGGWGKNKNAAPSVSKSNISDFSSVNFSNHENVSLTIYVTAAHNSGTNSYTVTLIDSNGNKVSNYQLTKTDGMGSGSNAGSARESSLTFTPTQAFSGYKIEFYPKSFITQTRYVLTYDDKSISCSTPPTVGTNLTSVSATANSITATVPISSIGGCNITENGLVYSTTTATPTVGGSGCTKVTTTACGATAANKTVTISELTCGTTYYVRGFATNGANTSYTNVTTQATSACPKYTVTLMDDDSELEQATAGASVNLPSRTGCTGYTFAGWTKSWASAQSSWTTTAPTIINAGSYTPQADENLYPVYTKETTGGAKTYTVTTTLTAGKTYVFGAVKAAASSTLANNTTFGAVAFTNTYNSTSPNWGAKVDLTPNTSGVLTGTDTTNLTAACKWVLESVTSGNYAFKNGSNYIYLGSLAGSTTNGAQSGVSTSANVYIENVNSTCKDAFLLHPASNSTNIMLYNTSSGYRMYASRTYSNTMTPYVRFYEYNPGVTISYISEPDCCDPLGTISGAVTLTQLASGDDKGKLQATWSMASKTGLADNGIKINIYKVGTATAVHTSAALSKDATSYTWATAPDKCTEYYATLTTIKANNTYCEGEEQGQSENVTTAGYTITYNLTDDHVTKKSGDAPTSSCDGDIDAYYEAVSGYVLPSSVTVTNAGDEEENWTWNSSTGELTILAEGITGDVAVTITADAAPCDPMSNPSVTVEKTYNGATLSWSAISHAAKYKVHIYNNDDSDLESNENVTGTSYTVSSTLTGLTTYKYRVDAVSENESSYCSSYATGSFTTPDYPTVKLYYSENGELSAGVDQKILTNFTLPNTAAECNKTFIGWTTLTSYSHASAAPTPFMEKGATWQIPTNAKCTLYAVYADVVQASTSWTRVTAVNTLTGGGTFIMGYEGTAKSGVIVPMRNSKSNATTSAQGYILSGTTDGSSTSGTITMSSLETSSDYEIAVESGTASGTIAIKIGSNYIGKGTSGNNVKLFTTKSTLTDMTPELNSNDVIRLKFSNDSSFQYNNSGSARFSRYKNGQQDVVFYKKNVTPASTTNYALTCMGKVAKPSITGVTGSTTYETDQTVTITSATAGATIKYTTDGSDPASSATTMATGSSFTLSTNGTYTIRAIAVKADMMNSDEATAVSNVTIDKPYTTIASFIAAEPTDKKLVFTGAKVLGVTSNYIYIQDATGGIQLNKSSHGLTFASGKTLSGYVVGTYSNNSTSAYMPRLTFTDGSTMGVTEDAAALPEATVITAGSEANICKLVKLQNVKFQSTALSSNTVYVQKSDLDIDTVYNTFSVLDKTLPNIATSCDVTGVLIKYSGKYEIAPVSRDGITTNGAKAILPTLSPAGSTNSGSPTGVEVNEEITVTPAAGMTSTIQEDDETPADLNSATEVTIDADKSITVTASAYYYDKNSATYYYHPDPSLTKYAIGKSAMTNGGVTVKNGDDVVTQAVSGATITLLVAPTTHYHMTGISVKDADQGTVTLTEVTAGEEYTFTMPAKAVTVSATFAEDAYATVAFAKGNESATGSAPSSISKRYVGQTATMPANTFALAAHDFAGWKYGENVYNAGASYTILAEDAAIDGKTITFDAQWTPWPDEATIYSSNISTTNADSKVIPEDEEEYDAWKIAKGSSITLTIPAGTTTIYGHLVAWNKESANVTISGSCFSSSKVLTPAADGGIANSSPFTLEEVGSTYYFKLTPDVAITENVNITFTTASDKRAVVFGVNAIYPKITLDPEEYEFGNVRANQTKSQEFTITTNANVSGTLSASITNDASGKFSVGSISAGKVTVTFDPDGATSGDFTAKLKITASNASVTADLSGTAIAAEAPEITVDKNAVAFGQVDPNASVSETIAVGLLHIDGAVSAALSGTNANKFSLSTTSLSSDGELVVTPVTTAIGIYSATLTLSATGADNVVLPISMTVASKWATTYTSNVTVTTGESKKANINSIDYDAFKKAKVENATLSLPKGTQKLHLHVVAWNGEDGDVIISGSCFNEDKVLAVTDNAVVSGTGATYTFTEAEAISYYHELAIENEIGAGGTTVSITKSGSRIVLFGVNQEGGTYEIENDANISTLPENANIEVKDGVTLTVDADKTIGDLTVENGGKVTLSNKLTVVGTFSIETTMAGGNSGQLEGATASNFEASEAYIDITLGAGGTNQQWHAFTVPFPVDVMNGIYDLDGNKLTNEVNYAIMDYHGDIRAQGQYGWKKNRGVLVPGTFYIMATDGYRTTYRFKKTANGALVAGNSKAIYEYASSTGGNDNGWNGIGNPNLFYGKVNLAVQVLDPNSYTFITKTAQSTNFVVGTPFFYQATADGTMVMETANAGGNYAPARERAMEIKDVPVGFGNEDFTDYLYVTANEDALNEYETGKDLAKMTMTNTPKVAQIFGKAYNTKLSMVNVPMVNDQAEVALELYAPQAGTYTISVPTEREDASLYLTKDGNIIWDLTMSPYEAEFDKGATEGYGLMLVRKAPQVTTGVETIDNSQFTIHNCQKVILNDHVYILREGQLYDVTGKAVK